MNLWQNIYFFFAIRLPSNAALKERYDRAHEERLTFRLQLRLPQNRFLADDRANPAVEELSKGADRRTRTIFAIEQLLTDPVLSEERAHYVGDIETGRVGHAETIEDNIYDATHHEVVWEDQPIV